MYALTVLTVFAAVYLLQMTYISVFYHRGIAHGSVTLHPLLQRFVVHSGNWVTGMDPKGWAVMHRLHHTHSDTDRDPHSPMNLGLFGVMWGQLVGYRHTLAALKRHDPRVMVHCRDLDFEVSVLNRTRLWVLPYVLHTTIAGAIVALTGGWLLGLAYLAGMMSHPVQGWIVNAFAHRFGRRDFDTPDNSRNNDWVSWIGMGEGYQNNHHAHPRSPKFAMRWFEVDYGYTMCLMLERLGLLRVRREWLAQA